MRPHITLCMIVKDETPVLRRCFESVLPLIDAYSIVDTGSTDGTPKMIPWFFDRFGVPGVVHHAPWRNFASNRTEALRLAASAIDGRYLLVIDADDVLRVPSILEWPPGDPTMIRWLREEGGLWPSAEILAASPAWGMTVEDAGITYPRGHLISAGAGLTYRGVVHEFLNVGQTPLLTDVRYVRLEGGARSRDGERAKYLADIITIEMELRRLRAITAVLRDDPDLDLIPRYEFYRAQSLRDAGETQRAAAAYNDHSLGSGRPEERSFSAYEAARLGAEYIQPCEVVERYRRAFEIDPSRAEPLVQLAGLAEDAGLDGSAWIFARAAVALEKPPMGVFIDASVYDYVALSALAIAAANLGRFDEALGALGEILKRPLGVVPLDILEDTKAMIERVRARAAGEGA